MTLTLDLTPELQERLRSEASQHGLPVERYAVEVLDKHLASKARSAGLVSLLQNWIDHGDSEEQSATGSYLLQALDEDRLSDRKLFPAELKGVTW
jgi:hypothetical protein